MLNPIVTGINYIKRFIPGDILKAAFASNDVSTPIQMILSQSNISLDASIKQFIKKTIIPDCNMVGGKTKQIALKREYWERTNGSFTDGNTGDGDFSVYRIPPEARDNGDIIEVSNIAHPNFSVNTQYMNTPNAASMCNKINGAVSSFTGSGIVTTPIGIAKANNIIQLHPGQDIHTDWVCVCLVSYTEEMTNLGRDAIEAFATLCLQGIKLHCYTELIVNMDRSTIAFGKELSAIRSIVEPWGELLPEYNETLKRFQGQNMLDLQTIAPILKRMI